MPETVISVENLSKQYRLGNIGTGTFREDVKVWWARRRGKPNPVLKIGQVDHGNRDGQTIWALKDVSFQVNQGEVLGIIGRNGAGKSTLLKILSRVTAPTSGCIKVYGRIASLLEVGTGFHPELTGRENTYLNGAILGMKSKEIDRKFDEIVEFSGVELFIDTPVKRYSSGMYVRLAFAVAAHLEPEILIVDEVLAVGDAEFQKKCLGKMSEVAGEGRTVLFVSHNMKSIIELCNHSIMLSEGKIIELGDTGKIVDHYLKRKDTNVRKVYANQVFDRRYSGPYHFLSVWVEDNNGNEKYSFIQHDPIVFCMQVNSSSKPVIIGVSVRDTQNQLLFLLSNVNDKVELKARTDESIIKVKLDDLLLKGGEYYITFVLSDENNTFCERWGDVLTINVNDLYKGNFASSAPFVFEAKWRISENS